MFGDLNLEVVFTTLAPPSTPATGVNWARKASRNIGATFIARMQPSMVAVSSYHRTDTM